MALTDDQAALELAWKLAQIQADIELKQMQIRKARQDWWLDCARVAASLFVALAAVVGGFVGLSSFLGRH